MTNHDNNAMPELLPCPWCAKLPEERIIPSGGGAYYFAIRCKNWNCPVEPETGEFETPQDARAAWNRRAARREEAVSIENEFPNWCSRRAKECREAGDEYDAQMFDEAGDIWRELRPTAPAGNTCWCLTCDPVTVRMALCPDCGNKRCPKANDHRNTCTGSNEPGQKGSAYENCTAPAGNGGEVDWSVIEPVLICIDDLSEFLSEAPSTKLGAGTYAEAALDIRAAANLIRTLAKKPD